MSNDTIITCSGVFYDSGGSEGNYSNGENKTMVFISANGHRLRFDFQSFQVESSWDKFKIYDGPNINSPFIGEFSGSNTPGVIVSTGTSLTFVFTSDGSTNYSGWAAVISCTTPALVEYPMSTGTVTTCSALFTDSGGTNGNYSNNEDATMTFCSTGSDYVTVTFLNFGFNLAAGDTLFAYDGPNTSSPMIGAYCGTMIPEPISSQTGSCITFRFKSDLTAVSSGWRAVVECSSTPLVNGEFKMMSGIRYTCGGVFYDSGGPNGNYKNNESNTLTFVSSENRRLQFNFQTFYTEVGDNLYIYDGPTTNHPLIGVYSGSAGSPGIVQSTGTSMTFRFVSDGSYNYPGWAALISCTTPALPVYNMSNDTVFTCEGVFYDSGGPDANYMHNDNKVMTFCSENEEFIHFTFQPNNFKVHLSDTLYVYDGASVSAPIIGKYTGDRLPEVISSLTGSCLTFKFVSDLTNHDAGWQALIGCTDTTPVQVDYRMQNGVRYTCGGIFYDSGGLNANYSANENYTETFVSSTGSRLQFNFQAFSTESTDKLYIYDGPTVNHPLIGVYSGSAGSPGIVQSSGTSLTFKFVSDQNTQYAGWAAFITCTTPALPVYNISNGTVTTCEGVFYDSGGPTANYPYNETREMTFCSENEEFIYVTFQPNNFNVHLSDTLFVYDGANSSAPPIGFYYGNRLPEIISSQTGSCLTFKFVSDFMNHDLGWQALIDCDTVPHTNPQYLMQNGVRYVSDGWFYDSGGPNANYKANESYTETFISASGTRLQFNFQAFSTESTDKLYIYDGPTVNHPLIGVYSGGTSGAPGIVQSTGTSLTFKFVSDNSTQYAGWQANISCTTAPLPTYNMSNTTITTCEAVFYDSGGPTGNYSNNENLVMTFCSADSSFVKVDFTRDNLGIYLGDGDMLKIYDGPSISSSPLAIIYGYDIPEAISSITGPCLTFQFISSTANVRKGWQAIISCVEHPIMYSEYRINQAGVRYVCEVDFYDTGGPNGFYGSSENLEMTFCSNNDCNITAEFEHFYTENNFDKLYIYDGMSVNDTWLYTCTGNTFPQSVTSSNQCLTFKFVSDYSGNYSGLKINLNCNKATITASPSAVACDGDPVNLTANQGVAYIWSTGANTQSISVVAAGNYVVTVTDENECSRPSAPVVVNINPLPPTPTISVNEGLLQATPSSGYTFKWYFNGTLISGANLSFYWPTQNGVYMVEITDQLGCSSVSAPYNVQFVGIDENVEDVFTKLYPNPLTTQTTLLINTSHSAYLHVECFDVTGKKIATIYQGNLPGGANEIDIDAQQLGLVSGTYILRILCDNQMIHHKMMISNQ